MIDTELMSIRHLLSSMTGQCEAVMRRRGLGPAAVADAAAGRPGTAENHWMDRGVRVSMGAKGRQLVPSLRSRTSRERPIAAEWTGSYDSTGPAV